MIDFYVLGTTFKHEQYIVSRRRTKSKYTPLENKRAARKGFKKGKTGFLDALASAIYLERAVYLFLVRHPAHNIPLYQRCSEGVNFK